MAYRPPQRRHAPPPQQQQQQADGARHGAPPPTPVNGYRPSTMTMGQGRPGPSRRDWTSPPSASLQSPAGDIRPMRRMQEVNIEEMDMIQSVSRSGGDGAEGDALKDHDMQTRYRDYIDERIDKHYARFGTERDVAPSAERTDEIESLSSTVLLLRKLREGVVASSRIDDFAIEVFEQSVRLAILAKHQAQLISALSGLVPGLYLAVDDHKGKARASGPASDGNENLATEMSRLGLAASDKRQEFASIRLLYHLVQSNASAAVFHDTLLELTAPPPRRLGSAIHCNPPLLSRDHLSFAIQASRYLSAERFNPLDFFTLLQDDTRATSYERTVLGWATDKVRDRAWEVMKRAYISTELGWAGRLCGLPEAGGAEEWIRRKGHVVESGKVKLR